MITSQIAFRQSLREKCFKSEALDLAELGAEELSPRTLGRRFRTEGRLVLVLAYDYFAQLRYFCILSVIATSRAVLYANNSICFVRMKLISTCWAQISSSPVAVVIAMHKRPRTDGGVDAV